MIEQKLKEYESLLDFNNNYFRKDFKGNLKFVKDAIKRMIHNNTSNSEIIEFIEQTIKIHKKAYI